MNPLASLSTDRGRGIVLGIAAALLISMTNVFSRLHFDAGSNPVTFMLARYILFVAALFIGLALFKRLPRIATNRYRDVIAAGLLNVVGATCLAFSIERLQVGLAIAVLYLFPIFTLLIDSVLRKRLPSSTTIIALLIAFAGLVLALDVAVSWPDPIGVGFALAAALCISGSFVWIDWRLDDLGDAARVFWLSVVALIFSIVLALTKGGVIFPLPTSWAWVTLVIATATFGGAYAAMFVAIGRIGAPTTSVLMNLEPPATALFATLLLGDHLGSLQMFGITLVIAAVLFAQRAGRHMSPAAATP